MVLHGLDKAVVNMNGEEMQTPNGKIVTYKSLIMDTLLAQNNEKIGGLSKRQCFDLSKKLQKVETDMDFTLSQINAIKALAEMAWPVYIFGVLDDFIESGGIRDEAPNKAGKK